MPTVGASCTFAGPTPDKKLGLLNNNATHVVTALGAGYVLRTHVAALRAGAQLLGLEKIVSATGTAPGVAVLPFGDCHGKNSYRFRRMTGWPWNKPRGPIPVRGERKVVSKACWLNDLLPIAVSPAAATN